ncbi:MAG: SHOCT domain-containing protein [Calditrichae bacterium]|nr:SHOCT domain-containing protein [Calditrichia bacterium]
MWFGWIFWFMIIGLIIWGIVTITNINRNRNQRNYFPPQEEALEILKKRYAQGEITREQFEQMKRNLQT